MLRQFRFSRRLHRLTCGALGSALSLTLLLAFGAPTAAAESNGGVRVMPLGDSLTDGYNIPGGYRIDLWKELESGGYIDDFVGSQSNGPKELGDHDHEGHSGWRIGQIDDHVKGWLRGTDPRTVLLTIGTNDMLQDHQVDDAASRLSTLVDHITSTAPDADVFVSDLIPIADSEAESRAEEFNATVPAVVHKWASQGRHVHFVEMHTVMGTDELTDGVHPNREGYDLMAERWYSALEDGPWI